MGKRELRDQLGPNIPPKVGASYPKGYLWWIHGADGGGEFSNALAAWSATILGFETTWMSNSCQRFLAVAKSIPPTESMVATTAPSTGGQSAHFPHFSFKGFYDHLSGHHRTSHIHRHGTPSSNIPIRWLPVLLLKTVPKPSVVHACLRLFHPAGRRDGCPVPTTS